MARRTREESKRRETRGRTEVVEVVVLLASLDDSVSEVDGTLTTLGPVVRRDSLIGTSLERVLLNELQLGLGIGSELVDGDNNLDAVLLGVGDVLAEVDATLLERDEILVEVSIGEGLARGDFGSTTVHLKSSDRGNEDDGVGLEARDSALDVAEL